MGDGVANTLQDKDAVDAGMRPRVKAGGPPLVLPVSCPLLLTSTNVQHLGRGEKK